MPSQENKSHKSESESIAAGAEESSAKSKKLKTRRVIQIVLIAVLVVSFGTTAVLGIYGNHLLNKLNYEDESENHTGTVNQQFEDEENIDFISDSNHRTTSANEETTLHKRPEQTTHQRPPATSLVHISSVKDGVEQHMNLTQDELKDKAAEIQKEANEDIKQNTQNKGDVWTSRDVFNMLIIGYDAGDMEKVMFEGMKYPRSDCIIVASVNKKKKTINLVSLSRATYVAISGHGNKRINTAYAYGGPKSLINTIESNYKIKIDNYVAVDFSGFKKIVDAMGGVSVGMTETEASFAFNKDTPKGVYKMNGHQTLRYVRLRKTDSDRCRTGRQRRVLKAMIRNFKGMSIPEELNFLETVFPYVTTNMEKPQIVKKITECQSYLDFNIKEDIIPHNAVQLSLRDGKEVLILDWNETTSYLHKLLYEGVDVQKTTVAKI